ncbi:hypothetical protein HAX54_025965 [Datura stramonium]|uniref:Uncharacterized protein n=1 Tax=Datura stramonium TaxID=4076 RepID=A0ABS8V0J9_DATST|nr:hypothetical protein [Datura stramonium]
MEYDSLSRCLGGEMVDTRDSKSRATERGGSSPLQGIILRMRIGMSILNKKTRIESVLICDSIRGLLEIGIISAADREILGLVTYPLVTLALDVPKMGTIGVPAYSKKGLVLWKIYLVSGTAWFHSARTRIILLKLILFIINDPLPRNDLDGEPISLGGALVLIQVEAQGLLFIGAGSDSKILKIFYLSRDISSDQESVSIIIISSCKYLISEKSSTGSAIKRTRRSIDALAWIIVITAPSDWTVKVTGSDDQMSRISRKSDSIDGIWYEIDDLDEIDIPIFLLRTSLEARESKRRFVRTRYPATRRRKGLNRGTPEHFAISDVSISMVTHYFDESFLRTREEDVNTYSRSHLSDSIVEDCNFSEKNSP